ncbi:hypothetical protein GMSM_17890 [Geomonas sp. Red276]
MPHHANAADLVSACQWLDAIVTGCLKIRFGKAEKVKVAPLLSTGGSSLARFIATHKPTDEELVVLLLALVPHLDPSFFSSIIAGFLPEGGEFPEFGGVRGKNQRGILPSGETAQFVVAGGDLKKRLEVQRMLSGDHWFARLRLIWLDRVPEGEPAMSGQLVMEPELVEYLTLGKASRPAFSSEFPAEYLETGMEWEDLVLHPDTRERIAELEHWIAHHRTVLDEWGMKRKFKPGYRALFHGPPGTGKTLTATLLGKYTGRDVFRIDLSRVISKYIGETEKNLARLFDKAQHKEWILFFDEADALFGKRTEIRDAHDKYANQEVAYLLQRIESYPGVVILSTNQRGNIDDAFARRFQSIVNFPLPRPEERRQIWERAFPSQVTIGGDIDWGEIGRRYEITGAGITNVTQYCIVEALADGSRTVDLPRLHAAVLREYVKDGKVV